MTRRLPSWARGRGTVRRRAYTRIGHQVTLRAFCARRSDDTEAILGRGIRRAFTWPFMGLPTGPWLLGPEEAIVPSALAQEAMGRFGATVALGYREKISARTAANSSSRNPSRKSRCSRSRSIP